MAAVPGISHQSSGPPAQDVIEVTATRKDDLV
jgi:hypothetical protein